MLKQKILIVDDDENIAELISLYLEKEQYDTETAHDGEEALKLIEVYNPDLLLLDLMLPGIDGYEVCQQVRKTRVMLSAQGEVFDKVLGLKMGADDYMVKPFDANELIARVSAVLRRSGTSKSEEPNPTEVTDFEHTGDYIEYEGLIVNISNYTVTFEGSNIEMPPKELELLYFLGVHPNQVFTRDQLLNQLWGYDFVGDTRTVDVHIKRLREKLSGEHNWSIQTVYRIGYKFEVK